MIRTRTSALAWLAVLLPIQAGCHPPPPQPRTEPARAADAPHVVGTNLPRWAACWFPQWANPGAIRRAQPCPSEAAATTAYTARELEGCWLFTGDDGRPPYRGPFFSAPVRLKLEASARLRARGWTDPGMYHVEPLAVIPGVMAHDTILSTTYWKFAAPDSLSIIRTTGYSGVRLEFRVRGDSLVGMAQGFWDVIEMSTDTVPDPVTPVRGRRVDCPSATRAAAGHPGRSRVQQHLLRGAGARR